MDSERAGMTRDAIVLHMDVCFRRMTAMHRFARRYLAALAGLLTLLGMAGGARADLRIVATVPDLAAVAKAVGGDHVSVESLAAPSEDPHYVDPRPSFLPRLARADVVIAVGLELEVGWLPPLLVNARNAAIQMGGPGYIDASTFVREKLQVPTMKIDRSMGDLHPGGNPHFHTSPLPMVDVALGLGERFAALDPTHAAAYRAGASAYAAELRTLAERVKGRFAKLPAERRRVVVFHDSFRYLVHWLGLEQVATIEERPGIRPSPGRVATVLGALRSTRAGAILQEEWHLDGVSKMLAQKGPARLIKVKGGAAALTGAGYLAYLDALAKEIADALE
jgi:zinc/manganese transport system substrate-binding protein